MKDEVRAADFGFPDSPDEPLRSTTTRNGADFHFWLAKSRSFARVDDVAQHGEFEASAQLSWIRLDDTSR